MECHRYEFQTTCVDQLHLIWHCIERHIFETFFENFFEWCGVVVFGEKQASICCFYVSLTNQSQREIFIDYCLPRRVSNTSTCFPFVRFVLSFGAILSSMETFTKSAFLTDKKKAVQNGHIFPFHPFSSPLNTSVRYLHHPPASFTSHQHFPRLLLHM